MPIKNLTERARMPRLGKIHLGIKVKSKNEVEIPRATDYFVLPLEEHPELKELYGEQPKSLPIMFPTEDLEDWASQYYRYYSRTRGLVCKGDGEVCTRKIDAKTGDAIDKDTPPENIELKEVPCKGRECPDYQSKKCREMMMLQFLLHDAPGVGVWQIDTSSINSIMNINSTARLIKRLYGRVSLLPLNLTLEPQQTTGSDGKSKTVHCMNIRARETLRELMQVAAQPIPQMLTGSDDALLPDPDDVEPEIIEGNGEPEPAPVDVKQAEKDTEELWPEGGEKSEPEQATLPDVDPKTKGPDESPFDIELIRKYMKVTGITKEGTMSSYIVNTYKIAKGGTLQDHLDRLSPEQAEELAKELRSKLS